jgi:hypothetical protein
MTVFQAPRSLGKSNSVALRIAAEACSKYVVHYSVCSPAFAQLSMALPDSADDALACIASTNSIQPDSIKSADMKSQILLGSLALAGAANAAGMHK